MIKKVLYLTYEGLTDDLGQSQILPYLVGLAQQSNYHFTVISFEKKDRFQLKSNQIRKDCDKANITWKPQSYTKQPSIISTILDLRRMLNEAQEILKWHKIDLVHCRAYLPCLLALKLKEKHGIPFVFDMRGFWPDERVDGNIWNLKNPIYKSIFKYFKKKERQFLESSDAIVCLTKVAKIELTEWFNNDPLFGGSENYYNFDKALKISTKTFIIPCSADTSFFNKDRISKSKKKWLGAVHGIDTNKEYLGYVGSVGTWYLAKEMVKAYAHILKNNPEIRFLILSSDNIDKIREFAKEEDIPSSYIIHVQADRKDIPVLIALFSVSIFFIKPAYSKKASSPTKMGEILAMGIPIICNDNVGDVSEIVKGNNVGIVLDNPVELCFDKISANWSQIKALDPESITHTAETYLSLEKGLERYEEVYDSVILENLN